MNRSGILIGLAACALLYGAAQLVFTAVGATQIVSGKQVLLLKGMRYDPNADAMGQYERLYTWTEHVLRQRIYYERAFNYVLGTSCLVVGLLLIAWTVDRERLRRRAGNGDTV
jgi:hypothetical protein